jgi:hypothetical protein
MSEILGPQRFERMGFKKKEAPTYTLYEGALGDCPWKFHAYIPKDIAGDNFSNLLAQFQKTFKVITELGVFNVDKESVSLEISDLEYCDPGVKPMFPEKNQEVSENREPITLDFNEITKEICKRQNFLLNRVDSLNIQVLNNYLIKVFETAENIPQKFVSIEGRHDDMYGVVLDLETRKDIHKLVAPYFKTIFDEDIPELATGLMIGDEEI